MFSGKEVDLARSLFDKQHDFNGTSLEVNKIQQSFSTEICIKLFKRSSRNKHRLFSISLNFYQTNLLSSLQSRYIFIIKKMFLINVLKVIPGETQDDLLRIAIDLPKSR